MIRLLAFIIVFALFLAFIVFNLENKCNVSFGFKTFEDIPVFLTAFSSFVVGMLFAVPFVLSIGRRRRKKDEPFSSPPSGGKKRRGLRNKAKDAEGNGSDNVFSGSPADEIKKENSSYGID